MSSAITDDFWTFVSDMDEKLTLHQFEKKIIRVFEQKAKSKAHFFNASEEKFIKESWSTFESNPDNGNTRKEVIDCILNYGWSNITEDDAKTIVYSKGKNTLIQDKKL